MSWLKGKKVLVVGLAKSGIAAVKFVAREGARVTANDLKPAAELGTVLDEISRAGGKWVVGSHPPSLFVAQDLIVISPGVPRDLPALLQARAAGVPVLSELAFAARFLSADMIAVTGTNGKSTTVTLIGEIMKSALGEENVFVGGNLGTPLTELLLESRPVQLAVVEVSSFQLEYAPDLHPRVAVMLNVTPDHLDRYRDFDDYAQTKWRIFANMNSLDFAVINLDDPVCGGRAHSLAPRVLTISLSREPAAGMRLQGEVLEYRGRGGEREVLPVREVPLHGLHNLMNVMAAVCSARARGVEMAVIREAVARFKGLAHRLELVRDWRGVKFYNDSKATNVGSVEADVRGLPGPLILLMGGLAKGCSFVELSEKIRDRVKLVVAFGESKRQLAAEMGDKLPVRVVDTLEQALAEAVSQAAAGDSILLAPGGASFDQFRDYRHRGEVFRRLVLEMA